jgi:hypothetical protein
MRLWRCTCGWRRLPAPGVASCAGLQRVGVGLDATVMHIAPGHVVRDGQKIRKDTRTQQDRHLAIKPVTRTKCLAYVIS